MENKHIDRKMRYVLERISLEKKIRRRMNSHLTDEIEAMIESSPEFVFEMINYYGVDAFSRGFTRASAEYRRIYPEEDFIIPSRAEIAKAVIDAYKTPEKRNGLGE